MVRGAALVALVALTALLAIASGASAWVEFHDAAADAGIEFQLAGMVPAVDIEDPWPMLPEIIGGGACWADVDGDGYDDLYLVNQQFNPDNPMTGAWGARQDPTNRLYLNNGDGTFTDATESAGVESRRFGYACSAADYDGDGDVDLYVSVFGDERWGGNQLFRNNGDGTFTDVAEAAGVSMLGACDVDHPCMATSSAWGDYDLDGDLDLFQTTYVKTNMTDVIRGPNFHVAELNFLFRNEADGTFSEVAEAAGVEGRATDFDGSKSFGVAWFDADNDGDLDLFVANDETRDEFYVNNGDGTFVERSQASGLDDPRAGMGLTVGDYDNDGWFDLFFTHYQTELNGFYRNLHDGTFEDRSGEDDQGRSRPNVGWGTSFVDLDRDADLDLFVANGHTEWWAPTYQQTSQVFRNDPEGVPSGAGDRHWVDMTNETGPATLVRGVGRGAAFADHDLDGDTDVVLVPNNNESARLLEASGVEGHWLYVALEQPGMNRHAIGARVVVEAAGIAQHREVQAGSSFLSQNTLNLEFGLGDAERADRVTVQWPGGGVTVLEDVEADRIVRVNRATGTFVTDTLSPLTRVRFDGAPENGWFRGPLQATLFAEDRAVGPASGVAGTEFALGAGNWTAHGGERFPFTSEGVHELHARSVDLAGNVEPRRTTLVRVDLTKPEVEADVRGEAGANGWWIGDGITVEIAAFDALSGVRVTEQRVDGGAWATYGGPILVDAEGTTRVEARAIDRAGNVGEVIEVVVRFDPTPPDVTLARPARGSIYAVDREFAGLPLEFAVILSGPAGESAAFKLRADAADATSGVDRVLFIVDDEVVAVDREAPFEVAWDLRDAAPGAHRVQALALDVAGNAAVSGADVVVVRSPEPPAPAWGRAPALADARPARRT